MIPTKYGLKHFSIFLYVSKRRANEGKIRVKKCTSKKREPSFS
jgi:hypothetical protein